MWSKTLTGFVLGLLLSVSLLLNLNGLLPFAIDVRLLIGLLIGFVLWAGAMVYCYFCSDARSAALGCLKVLAVSVVFNAITMLTPV